MGIRKNLEDCTILHTRGWETEIEIKLSVMVLQRKGVHECYLGVDGQPYKFMFGLPVKQQTRAEAMQIAINNATDYLDLFNDEGGNEND